MPPSSTVENYLKVIHLQHLTLDNPSALVGMGQLAAAVGVTPGSATTMVKTLAEAGLVHYEPYAGVRLLQRANGWLARSSGDTGSSSCSSCA
jgi:DtxR family Mn-dependent transcriptional regulator